MRTIEYKFTRLFSILAFACLGFLSPANRGALMTCAMVLYVCLGTIAGYVSARIYKSFGGEKWKSNVLLTSMLSPGYFSIIIVCSFSVKLVKECLQLFLKILQTRLWTVLHHELGILGKGELCCGTVQHIDCSSCIVVWSVCPLDIHRCLSWIQEEGKSESTNLIR